MNRFLTYSAVGLLICIPWAGDATGRGFGGFRGGGFGGFGGFRGGYSGGFDRSYSGYRGSYSGSRSYGGYSGWDRGGYGSSYDRSYTGARGGSINTEGTRGAYYGPRGAAAGGTRDTTVTGPEGRTYSGSTERGAAVGPYGRYVGGGEHTGTATGYAGSVTRGWQSAFAGRTFPSDAGLAHYSSFGSVSAAHTTAYWSHGYCTAHAGYVRTGFGYYNCFHPAWYTAHPGCWYVPTWPAGAAWTTTAWPALATYCGIAGQTIDYECGDNVVYQNNEVYYNGSPVASASDYAQQAITLADQGQKATAPPASEWKPLGVFALAQGNETTSNNIFQLAINREGVIRGNFYDGLTDSTAPVYGSVDKESQRAAWTIGKKNDRVFDAGIYNLTQDETPVLVHIGKEKTQQMLLVRMPPPKDKN